MTTPDRPSRWTDHEVEQLVAGLLRIGVLVSAAVAALGGIALLVQHGLERADYHVFTGGPAELRSVAGIVASAARLQSPGVVQLGLVLLIAIPILRVALSLVAFVLQRDRLYIAITSVVLAILLFSLLSSGHP